MQNTTFDFSGSVVVVTGGANGIGRAICREFARAGANVLCIDVNSQAGNELAAGDNSPGSVLFFQGDVGKASDCRAAIEAAVERWGGLDIICNNAGIQPKSSYLPVHELPEEMWDRILDVNLKSTYLMSHYGIPHLRARGGGSIINTASVQGMASANLVSAYAASKGGLIQLTRWLATMMAPKVRVNAITPGGIWRNHQAPFLDRYNERTPLDRMGVEEDLKGAAAYLASDLSAYVTGHNLVVDGGFTIW